MNPILSLLTHVPEFNELISAIDNGASPVAITGLAQIHRAHFAAGIYQHENRPVVLICADEDDGIYLANAISSFTEVAVPFLRARSFSFHCADSVSHQWEQQRIEILHAMQNGTAPIVVATIEGILQHTISPNAFSRACKTLCVGQRVNLTELCADLVTLGYRRCNQVEGAGQFSLRGGILDVFSPGMPLPVRADFFDDEIDGIGFFHPDTQRRTENIDSFTILPAQEVLSSLAPNGTSGLLAQLDKLREQARKDGHSSLAQVLTCDIDTLKDGQNVSAPDRYLCLIYPEKACAAAFFPQDACLLFCETSRMVQRSKTYHQQLEADAKILLEREEICAACTSFASSFSDFCRQANQFPLVYLDSFQFSNYPIAPKALLSVVAKQLPPFEKSLQTAASDAAHYQNINYRCVILLSGEQKTLTLQNMMRQEKVFSAVTFKLSALPDAGKTALCVGSIPAGFEYPSGKIAILTETGIRGAKRASTSKRAVKSNRERLKSYADLSAGDLVVHEHHGIARYQGMVKMVVDGAEKDFVKLCYAGTDVLYVPATQLDLVSKYIGGGEDAAKIKKLSHLGGTDWQKAKSRARGAVADLAKGLIKLYAQRQKQAGYAFSPDTAWQKEFEQQFQYVETDDQLRCVEEIKRDMEKATPMDRLLCGDVGYGKTEVALRAVMKCVMDGKQAAILVPTTVLARQHYLTTLARFKNYPVSVDVVSRFRTPRQMKETLAHVAQGKVDILIGTHRLFQKDVQFKNLGLLVVDEEQRFGVAHKEKLKERFSQVDVLTLSATPIPRTLNMALSGIRDMSTLEQPPADRQPVQTYVLEHEWNLLCDAMRRELERGGQVIYLHNRVESIDRVAGQIQTMLGDMAAVAVAHGKMGQDEIDAVMGDMTDGTLNILVCTTIIETGVDLPNANTLIIEHADHLGLAQLHQIRGRVGRSNRRAYAYLTFQKNRQLTEIATKRLETVREFAEFGSGFKIAMRDLEIRGAGNVLGPEQSGFMLSVGYDMYLKLLEEAVLTQQGIPSAASSECIADIHVPASIPDRYIPVAEQRMDLYRRIAHIRHEQDADDLVDELIDRFGEPPRTVNNLISIALLRIDAAACSIAEITQRAGSIHFALSHFDLQEISALCADPALTKSLTFSPAGSGSLTLKLAAGQDVLRAIEGVISRFLSLKKPAPALDAAAQSRVE